MLITADHIKYNLIHLRQLIFEVTDACNLRCKYCGYADLYEGYDKRENLKFPFIRAKRIIDYLHTLWKENCVAETTEPITISFYGGEPLLNVPFIRQVIEYIESLPHAGKKFFYNMTTNAMLLDKYMDFLQEKEFRLLISLDGNEEGQGYRVDTRGNNSFPRVFHNIKLLQETYPEYFEKHVRFNAVLHNKNSVESIYHFIKDTFGKIPAISPLNNSGIRPDKIEEFNRTYRNYQDSINHASNCESLKAEMFINAPETSSLLNFLYYHSGNIFFDYNDLLRKKDESQYPVTGTCIPFAKKMFITVKGRILQCEKINHEFSAGYVTDEKVEMDFQKIADQQNGYTAVFAKQCAKCSNRTTCMQCIYQIDDIHKKGVRCYSFSTDIQKQTEQNQCLAYLAEHPELYKRILNEVTIRK